MLIHDEGRLAAGAYLGEHLAQRPQPARGRSGTDDGEAIVRTLVDGGIGLGCPIVVHLDLRLNIDNQTSRFGCKYDK